MSRVRRMWNIISGIVIILVAAGLFFDPVAGLPVVTGLISLMLTLRGIQTMAYYFSMARFMVGGKTTLYRGMFYLDLGILTSTVNDYDGMYIILYIAALHIFYGVVNALKGREAKALGSPQWKTELMQGTVNIIMAVAVIVGGLVFHSVRTVVFIYAAGLVYSACIRIGSAFRKTAIVYIQ